jgi:hypothetical protein
VVVKRTLVDLKVGKVPSRIYLVSCGVTSGKIVYFSRKVEKLGKNKKSNKSKCL